MALSLTGIRGLLMSGFENTANNFLDYIYRDNNNVDRPINIYTDIRVVDTPSEDTNPITVNVNERSSFSFTTSDNVTLLSNCEPVALLSQQTDNNGAWTWCGYKVVFEERLLEAQRELETVKRERDKAKQELKDLLESLEYYGEEEGEEPVPERVRDPQTAFDEFKTALKVHIFMIKNSICNEFNDNLTRSWVRNRFEDFIHPYLNNGTIYEFRVICDEVNNTPYMIQNGEFICQIHIKKTASTNIETFVLKKDSSGGNLYTC